MRIDSSYFRPTEVDLLIGNPAKAKAKLGWRATATMEQLCREMVQADLRALKEGSFNSAAADIPARAPGLAHV